MAAATFFNLECNQIQPIATLNLCLSVNMLMNESNLAPSSQVFKKNRKTRFRQDINKISASLIKPVEYLYGDITFPAMDFIEGIDRKIMDSIISLLFDALNKYSKILMIRVDIQCYESLKDNQLITSFRKRFMTHLRKEFNSDVWFMWVREQTSNNANTHYHCFVILNNHKALNNWSIKTAVEHAECMEPNIRCWYPKANAYPVYRGDINSLSHAVYRASYLAKNSSKEFTPKKIKRFQTSHQN